MNLFAQSAPTGLSDVLLIPGLCFLLGLGLWYGGLIFENRTEKTWLKWCAFAPLAIGVVVGIPVLMQSMDYTYQQLLPNKKVLYGHYAAPGLPLAGLIAVVVWHLYLKKSGAYEHHRL